MAMGDGTVLSCRTDGHLPALAGSAAELPPPQALVKAGVRLSPTTAVSSLSRSVCCPLLPWQRSRTALLCVVIQEKGVDIFTLSSYLQSKHISVFTAEHLHQEPWKRLEREPEHSPSFTGKPPRAVYWD